MQIDFQTRSLEKKYSLVYYLSVGDQDCDNPSILQFYNHNAEVLPSNGMMILFPADRYHSVKYNGNRERIIIGINFILSNSKCFSEKKIISFLYINRNEIFNS